MALSVAVGLRVMGELMAEGVTEIAGPRGKHDRKRRAKRHGREHGSVTLGRRRLRLWRPRVRSADDATEIRLRSYEYFAQLDLLAKVVLERLLAAVSCRRYERTGEPVGEQVETERAPTSRSSVSRTFVERIREALGELMSRRLDDVRLAVLMLDGIELKDRANASPRHHHEGQELPLGLSDGSTENATAFDGALGRPGRAAASTPPRGASRRRQGASHGDPRRLGTKTRVQRCIRHKGTKRARAPARAGPIAGEAKAAGGLGARLP